MIVTPSNELDAVNEILSTVGQSPLNSLENSEKNVDTINAQRILNQVSIEVQSRGYNFNTLNDVTLQGDSFSYKIPYPSTYIRVFSTDYKLIRKDGYFYDLESDTNQFPSGLTITELVKKVDFNDLPAIFRKYITVRASRIFQMRYLSAKEIDTHLQLEEQSAYGDIVDYELMTGNFNIFEDDQFISQQIQRS